MRTLTAQQSNILDSNAKIDFSWLFEVDTDDDGTPEYYWSTKAKSYGGQSYVFKALDFTPIRMRRGSAENDNIQTPAEITIICTNTDNALAPSSFEGGSILVRMVMKAELGGMEEAGGVWQFEAASGDSLEASNPSEDEICSWRFRTKAAYNEYQKLMLECQDWLAAYLEGDYPNTPLIHDLWPSDDPQDDNICVPLLFGTSYFPVRSAYMTDARYYVLGPSTPTYTISKIRSPREWGARSEWSSASYTFTQSNKTGSDSNTYKVVQFIIADSDNNGSADANGLFRQGERFLDVPCKYSRSDTASMTAPGDIIEYILEDMGVPSDKIDDTSKAVVNGYYSSWGLTFNVGLWYKMPRREILARLLTMCNTELIVRDKIYFKVHEKYVNLEIEKDLVRNMTGGEGSFSYSPAPKEQGRDSGYVAYRDADEPIDSLMRILVPAKGSTTENISKDVVHADYVQNSQNAQKIGTLAFQRRFMKDASVRFETKAKMMHLECDDVLQINPVDYGAGEGSEYDVLIDAMTIHHDGHLEFECTKFSVALDNWEDLSPGAVTIAPDDSSYVYEPFITGPDSPGQAGSSIPNLVRGRMRIGDGNEYIVFEPSEPLQTFVEGGVARLKVGDLGTDDFGVELLDHSGNSVLKLDGLGNKYISGIDMINNLSLGDGDSNPGTITLQLAAGQGDTYIAAGKTDFTNSQSGFILGIDDSDNDTAKIFIGDSTNYINWDGSGIKLYTSASDAIEIGAGGDIKLIASATDPGSIIFEGTNYSTEMRSLSASGDSFMITPDTPNVVTFYIGTNTYNFSTASIYATNTYLHGFYNLNNFSRIRLMSDSGLAAMYFSFTETGSSDGFTAYVSGSTKYIAPDTDNAFDLGRSSYRWKNLYLVQTLFPGTSYTTTIANSAADGSSFDIKPNTTNVVDAYIGTTTYKFKDIIINAYNNAYLRSYYSSSQYAFARAYATATTAAMYLYTHDNNVTKSVWLYHDDGTSLFFAPGSDNEIDLGSASYRWKNCYSAQTIFSGTSYSTTIANSAADGSSFDIKPGITSVVDAYIGTTTYKFKDIMINAHGNIYLRSYYSSSQYANVRPYATSTTASIFFYAHDNNVTKAVRFYHDDGSSLFFAPESDNEIDLGKTSGRWKDLYIAKNFGIVATSWGDSAAGVIGIGNGTAPTSSPADMIQIFSTDISGGDATLGLRTEATVAADTDETKFSHKLPVRINGATYYIMLTDS